MQPLTLRGVWQGMTMQLLRALMLAAVGLTCVGCGPGATQAPAQQRMAFVLAHVEHAHITFAYRAAPDDPRSARDFYVMLYVSPMPLEPIAHYPDGSPIGSARQVPADAMRSIVHELHADGFFTRARRLHSQTVESPQSDPPADSTDYLAAELPTSYPAGALEVRLVVTVGDWHHYFIHPYPLDGHTHDLLHRIAEHAPEEVRQDFDNGLLGKMR